MAAVGRPPRVALFGRLGVVAVEGDGGRVVVQLAQGDAELADRVAHQREDEGRQLAAEQGSQGPAHAVVVEALELLGRQAQQVGGISGRPLADAVQRLARDQQVAYQNHQGLGGGHLHPLVLPRQVFPEKLLQAEPLEDMVEDGQGPGLDRTQAASAGVGQLAGPKGFAATAACRVLSLGHRGLFSFAHRRISLQGEGTNPIPGAKPRPGIGVAWFA